MLGSDRQKVLMLVDRIRGGAYRKEDIMRIPMSRDETADLIQQAMEQAYQDGRRIGWHDSVEAYKAVKVFS